MSLWSKITELVDRDVARNRPISLMGVIVPWIPFMLFVKGPPIDTHPVLAELALGASFGWLLFVVFRMARYTRKQLEPSYKSLGAVRFWMMMAGTVVVIGLIAAVLMWVQRIAAIMH